MAHVKGEETNAQKRRGAHGPSVFLCHNHKDKPFARRLGHELERWGVDVWIDEAEIFVGDSLIEKIRVGIDRVDYLVAILSPSSVGSRWVKKELDVAMSREIVGRRVRVLPVLARPCRLPGFLLGKLYLDCTTGKRYRENFPRLLRRVLGRDVLAVRATRASLLALAGSGRETRTVIVVDDSELMRRYHADLLRAHGLRVLECECSEEVLDFCGKQAPDLVISNMIRPRDAGADSGDESYPWPEGLRLLYTLRRQGKMTPFMFISATYAEGYLAEARKLMVDSYLGRHESPEEFLDSVEDVLRRRAERTAE